MHGDVVADLDVGHVAADRVDDAARVGTDDVEVGRLTPSRLRLRDVDRDTARGPDVVEVDACGHRGHEDVVRPELRDVDHLVLDRVLRLAEPLGPDEHRVHLPRDLPDRRQLADVVDVLAHGSHLWSLVGAGTLASAWVSPPRPRRTARGRRSDRPQRAGTTRTSGPA
jgi:hypothetical protein